MVCIFLGVSSSWISSRPSLLLCAGGMGAERLTDSRTCRRHHPLLLAWRVTVPPLSSRRLHSCCRQQSASSAEHSPVATLEEAVFHKVAVAQPLFSPAQVLPSPHCGPCPACPPSQCPFSQRWRAQKSPPPAPVSEPCPSSPHPWGPGLGAGELATTGLPVSRTPGSRGLLSASCTAAPHSPRCATATRVSVTSSVCAVHPDRKQD